MGSYKWALQYQCDNKKIRGLLRNFGFERVGDVEDARYEVEVNDWNPLQAELKRPGEVEFIFYWMGESTTEIYYDYLINCGVLMGQLMVAIDSLASSEDEDDEENSSGKED